MALKPILADKQKTHVSLRDEESKKIFQSLMNANTIRIRLNMEERVLLSAALKKEDWNNISGYIKYKLFGDDIRRNYKVQISGDKLSVDDKIELLKTFEETLITQMELYTLLFRKGIEQLPDPRKHYRISNAIRWSSKMLKEKIDLVLEMQSSIISTLQRTQK